MIRRLDQKGMGVWAGYEEDPLLAVSRYVKGVSAGQAKKVLAFKLVRNFTGTDISWNQYRADNPEAEYTDYMAFVRDRRIDASKQKNAFKEGRVYMEDLLRNQEYVDRFLGYVKGLAVLIPKDMIVLMELSDGSPLKVVCSKEKMVIAKVEK